MEIRRSFNVTATYYSDTGSLESLTWRNDIGQKEAPGGFPARVFFYRSGNIRQLFWYKADKLHRDNDLPADLGFKNNSRLEINWALWAQDGKEHRDGDLPSAISIDDEDGRVSMLQFCRYGEECGIGNKPYFIWINPDGTTEDESGNPIDVDLSEYDGDLPRPPPFGRRPFPELA